MKVSAADAISGIKTVLSREVRVPVEQIPDDAALGRVPWWDSLGHIAILLALQREFKVEVSAESIQELVSIPRIAAHLAAGGRSGAEPAAEERIPVAGARA